MVSVQNPYSLLNRTYEIALAEITQHKNVGLFAYSPLDFGVLTGKYLNAAPKGARLQLFGDYFPRYVKKEGIRATQMYLALAQKHGLSPAQMALAFVNSRPFVTANIIGATTMTQLKENIESINLELSDEVLEGISAIHQSQPNPAP